MYLFVVSLHVLLCLFLIIVILLQPGKGGDPGSAFGGGLSSSVFGPRGPANLLSRVTTGVAVMFMVTSVTLALYSNRKIMAGGDLDDAMERLQQEELEKKQKGEAGGSESTPVEAPATDAPTLDAPPAGE